MKYWDKEPPVIGMKVVIVCDDGCSSSVAFIAQGDAENGLAALDGEEGLELGEAFTQRSIWFELPADFPVRFMEADDRP